MSRPYDTPMRIIGRLDPPGFCADTATLADEFKWQLYTSDSTVYLVSCAATGRRKAGA